MRKRIKIVVDVGEWTCPSIIRPYSSNQMKISIFYSLNISHLAEIMVCHFIFSPIVVFDHIQKTSLIFLPEKFRFLYQKKGHIFLITVVKSYAPSLFYLDVINKK